MKLIPDTIRAELVTAGNNTNPATGERTTPERCAVKLFDPSGRYTFYVFEAEEAHGGDLLLYGYVVSPLGSDCDEWGYASLHEIEGATGRFGLGIERDLHFRGITKHEIETGVRR